MHVQSHIIKALTADKMDYSPVPQLLLVGDAGVGKSYLLQRFCDDGRDPPQALDSTIGIGFNFRTIEIDDELFRLHIWDSSGQEQFRAVNKLGWRGAMGIMLVYNITDELSFKNIQTWHSDVDQYVPKYFSKILIGTKSDRTDKRAVTYEQARGLANELGINLFMETSAKVNEGVEEAFFTLTRDVKTHLIDWRAENATAGGSASGSVRLDQPAVQARPGCCL